MEPMQVVTHPTIDAALADAVAWAEGQETAFARLQAIRWLIDRLRYWSSMEQLGEARTATVRELSEQGWSYREIGEVAGVSVSRVAQWITGEGA